MISDSSARYPCQLPLFRPTKMINLSNITARPKFLCLYLYHPVILSKKIVFCFLLTIITSSSFVLIRDNSSIVIFQQIGI